MATRNTTTTTKPAREARAMRKAHEARANAKHAAHDEGDNDGDEAEGKLSQWAREKARAAAGKPGAAARFAKLAQVLLDAETKGEARISFADANTRAGLARGERGNPAASWRLALQRTRQLMPDTFDAWRVDADARALVRNA